MKFVRTLTVGLVLLLPAAAGAADLTSTVPGNVESFRYSWRLRGGLSWIAGIVFPRTGLGALKTTFPPNGQKGNISSELLITSPAAEGGNSFYVYQSEIDESGRTLMTYHGYAWGSRSRKESTVFDYVKRLAHLHKETPAGVENGVKPLPAAEFRDILTAIYFLRQNAGEIRTPITTTIYSDGKQYAVVFRPVGRATFTIGKDRAPANGFEVAGAPDGKRRWSGGVTVWVSDDARRIPCRIEISVTLASLQLDLQTVESYALLKP